MSKAIIQRRPVGSFPQFFGALPADPFETLASVGHKPPFWVESPSDVDGFWVVTRYEDALAILMDSESFSSLQANIPYMQLANPLVPTETDPPETQKYRNILLSSLTAKRVAALESLMKETASTTIAGFFGRGSCELISEFARVYPINVFLKFFGLPQEHAEEFRVHANTFMHSIEGREAAWLSIQTIVEEQLRLKRENPKDDLLSAIARGVIDGKPIDMQMAVNVASTVFLGGLDTLPSNIGWMLRYLATHPDARKQLIGNPGLIPNAVEEFLRYFAVANPVRRAKRDLTLGGASISADDRIYVSVSCANRDPVEFGEGVRFDREINRHLTFANGAHRCLGSHLARHELGIAISEFLKAIPEFHLKSEHEITYYGPIFAMNSLWLEWES